MILYVPEIDVPFIVFSPPSVVTVAANVCSGSVTTSPPDMENVMLWIVNDGIVAIPFMAGSVSEPCVIPVIANATVSLGVVISIVLTFVVEMPENIIFSGICAITVIAVRKAMARENNFFILLF